MALYNTDIKLPALKSMHVYAEQKCGTLNMTHVLFKDSQRTLPCLM